ncbi:hypothetical protein G6F63_016725 [Rhizopus arrhizus]|nr:hypothetical protein G6F63_016725 [Rhizopus arrhizus]
MAAPNGWTSSVIPVNSSCATSRTTANGERGFASGLRRRADQALLAVAAIRRRLPSSVAFAAPCVSGRTI